MCFKDLTLSIEKLRGQCYDGASTMAGSRRGIAKRISEIEPRAYFTHCYGHALNLAACDTLKKSKVMMNLPMKLPSLLSILQGEKVSSGMYSLKW